MGFFEFQYEAVANYHNVGRHLRLYALQIYHEISVDITDIRDIYRYLKVWFSENISCVFQIYKDI